MSSNRHTLYLTPKDCAELDALAAHLSAEGKRYVSRSDVVRHLLNQVMWVQAPVVRKAEPVEVPELDLFSSIYHPAK